MLKLTKNQQNAKPQPGDELLVFENYSHSSFTLSSKGEQGTFLKISKKTSVSVFMRLYD